MTDVRRGRLKLLLLALLFAAPLALAWLAYFGVPSLRPEGRLNYGTLIEPIRPLPALQLVDGAGAAVPEALRGKWSLLYLAGGACDATCASRLYVTRQVRLALAKNRERVQRVYLAPDAATLAAARGLTAEHHDLVLLADGGAPGRRAADFFQPADAHAVYLIDPLGNWVMLYTGELEPKGLHRDLRKLLRFSQVG
jgi:cytochrome oxidase Cu insertion factor (SCO1/SenC/PrrC family)